VALLTSFTSWLVEADFNGGNWGAWLSGFLQNFSTEMFGAFLTFLLLEILVRQRRENEAMTHHIALEKKRLIRQMSSRVNAQTQRAIEELRAQGWLSDGSLDGAYIEWADLQNSMLFLARLRHARLAWSRLQDSELRDADFSGADFSEANLARVRMRRADMSQARFHNARLQEARCRDVNFAGADLRRARLQGAKLNNANLRGALLQGAIWSEDTILPDGRHWSPGVDLARFTDPSHPAFWEPDWVHGLSSADNQLAEEETP
jgi:uncharacterized protein YjbI with pentapeptide repeats